MGGGCLRGLIVLSFVWRAPGCDCFKIFVGGLPGMRVSFCSGGFRGLRGFIDLLYFWRFPGFDFWGAYLLEVSGV